ncbi:MAG: DNA mismatch repair protein MutS, partial [Clostridia bacterium]|nr:DNA mismatch repair protein MutS [Clostridia bacterium]
MGELSPMMRQYLEIKGRNPDALLFFRLGDFYEMFFDDAKTASRELELVLTGRDCGLEERAPMCGVPFHSYEGYLARLVAKGYKVAICEQMEDPATAKGIVKRDVVRIVTPGTIIESTMLDETKNNYLCSVYEHNKSYGVCFADVSTGEMYITELSGKSAPSKVCDELTRYSPSEILLSRAANDNKVIAKYISERVGAATEVLGEPYFDFEKAELCINGQFSQEVLSDTSVLTR